MESLVVVRDSLYRMPSLTEMQKKKEEKLNPLC